MSIEKVMFLDYETYSSVDIKNGVYAYTESPDFEVLLVSFRAPGRELLQFSPREDGFDCEAARLFFEALIDESLILKARNAQFERVCTGAYFKRVIHPDRWRCTAVLCAAAGLPRSLDESGRALGLAEDERKLKTGTALINYFCKPCKPTAANGGMTRNFPGSSPEKWRLFKDYNRRDVDADIAIADRLSAYTPTEAEQRLYSLDQIIADRGVRADTGLIDKVNGYVATHGEELIAEMKELTGLDNPNSLSRLRDWLKANGAADMSDSMDKKAIAEALKTGAISDKVRRVLELRQQTGKTSLAKYAKAAESVSADGRLRGMLVFYGARTGRWSGRILQLQNLPQNHIEDLDLAHSLAQSGYFDALETLYGDTSDVLSQLIRTMLIPSEGCRFVVSDFSAIEARVIAWLADEDWRIKVFEDGGDIYCESASRMFGVPVEKHGQNAHLRQQGKVAELALGYGGSVGAIRQMDKKHAIPEDTIPKIVKDWRKASPHIVRLWKQYDSAATLAVQKPGTTIPCSHGISFYCDTQALLATLPSGRRISWWAPQVTDEGLTYQGIEQGANAWCRRSTYGGKLTENLVQATARDCLAVKMMQASAQGYRIVAHVHDEMIIDVPKSDTDAAKTIDKLMALPISWAKGLPLRGGTYECEYYQKD